ncbi:hypothetical protein [Nonomuraea sp. NPDC050786]|uniref:hypothetical protein n=1 Tax=Nonomuraea sp. NPDC050786 TaxID=3154840 RepID=UPI0033FBC6F4
MCILDDYIESANYDSDLAAVRSLWQVPLIAETAGVLVFLTYLALPVLLAVQGDSGTMARSTLDGRTERRFLLRLLGLTEEPAWCDGIRNPRVRALACDLAARHVRLPGMHASYLRFIGGMIALAPSLVTGRQPTAASSSWRYVTHAMSVLHAPLDDPPAELARCAAFVSRYASPSDAGTVMARELAVRHTRHVSAAIPALFPESRSAVLLMLQGV